MRWMTVGLVCAALGCGGCDLFRAPPEAQAPGHPIAAERGQEGLTEPPADADARASAELAMRQFFGALARSDLDAAADFYVSPAEFDRLFEADDPDTLYRDMRALFDRSAAEAAQRLQGARFAHLEADEAVRMATFPAGQSAAFGGLTLRQPVSGFNHMRVVLETPGGRLHARVHHILRVGDHWRLIDPIVISADAPGS